MQRRVWIAPRCRTNLGVYSANCQGEKYVYSGVESRLRGFLTLFAFMVGEIGWFRAYDSEVL